MKKIENWKIILILVITAFIGTRIGYITIGGDVDKQYYTSCNYEFTSPSSISCSGASQIFKSEETHLNSLEVMFINIADNKSGEIVICIYTDNELIYQANLSLSSINNWEWKKIFINAELFPDKEYKITFMPTEECVQIPQLIVTKDLYAKEIINSYSNGEVLDGQIAINYGFMKNPTIFDKCLIATFWIILWGGLFSCIVNWKKIRILAKKAFEYINNQIGLQIFVSVIEIIACLIIINCSGIEFQEPTKIIHYSISLLAVSNYERKSDYIKGITNKLWKKVLIVMLYCYAAFALVGQRVWIYPLNIRPTIQAIFVYVCAIVWFVPVINSLFYLLERVSIGVKNNKEKVGTRYFIVTSIIILLVPAVCCLIAYNPGISSYDTYHTMIVNAQNLYGMYDWHSAFYCMVLRVILEIWNSTYAVIIVQYFFWIYVIVELMLYLRKKGIRDSILYAGLLFFALNTSNIIHINTIWKDIPYTLSLLWALVIVAKLSIDFEEYKYKWYIYLELIVAFVGLFFYRKNGMVSFIVIIIPLVYVLRKNVKVLLSVVACIALICIIKGPIYDHFNIQDSGKRGMYIGLGQDILGVYYAGGDVSENTLKMINVMTDYNNAEYVYNPTWANQSYDLDVELTEFVVNYLDTFLKNPNIMLRAVIDRQDVLWDIYLGKGSYINCVNYIQTMDGITLGDEVYWNDYYEERQFVSLYPQMLEYTTYTADSQWISAIVWRSGVLSLIGLTALIFLLLKERMGKWMLIFSPGIGQVLSLLLSTGWSDFRYYWPMNLLNIVIVLLTIVIMKDGYRASDAY